MSDLFGKDIRKPICDSFESSNARLDQIFDVAESDIQTYTAILAAGNCRNKTVYALRDGGYTQFDGYLNIYPALNGGYLGDTVIDTCLLDNEMLFEKEYTVQRFGMKWEKNNPDPSERCTYLYDCAGWTPMQCQADGSVSRGSWIDNRVFFLKNLYPVMCNSDGTEDYKLSKTDHAYRENGVVPSDVSNTSYDGNAMTCFDCHIWIKFFEDSDYQGFEVANYQVDENFVDWPYIRADGSHADKLYYPMFEGTLVDGKLRSIASGKAQSGTTADQELSYAQENDGNGGSSVWTLGDWAHHLWLTCLSMLVGKTTAPQLTLGQGNTYSSTGTASDFCSNGALTDKGPFWGKPRSENAEENCHPVKVFYIENPWGNRWKRTLGFYAGRAPANAIYAVRTRPPYTVADEYNVTYSGCGYMVASSGWLQTLELSPCGFVPRSTGGSSTTYMAAYLFAGNRTDTSYMLGVGGRVGQGTNCGPWNMCVDHSYTWASWGIGASLYLIQPSGISS